MAKHKRLAVIGLGEFGSLLVRHLYDAGHEVLAIDRDMERVENIVPDCTQSVCLDSTDANALKAQELEDMDAVIVALTDFESLITTADNLRAMKIDTVMARYQNGLEFKILRMLGISELFNPGDQAARNMVEQFSHVGFHNRLIFEGEFAIVEVPVPASLVGEKVGDCGLRPQYRLNLVTIKRATEDSEGREIQGVPYADTIMQKGDTLVLFGKNEDIDIFLEDTRG